MTEQAPEEELTDVEPDELDQPDEQDSDEPVEALDADA